MMSERHFCLSGRNSPLINDFSEKENKYFCREKKIFSLIDGGANCGNYHAKGGSHNRGKFRPDWLWPESEIPPDETGQ